MCCIEKARQTRGEFVRKLQKDNRFPPDEAMFLTAITVRGDSLHVNGTYDSGRMTDKDKNYYDSTFPKGGEERKASLYGRRTRRKWEITSGYTETVQIRRGCVHRVESLAYLDRNSHLRID